MTRAHFIIALFCLGCGNGYHSNYRCDSRADFTKKAVIKKKRFRCHSYYIVDVYFELYWLCPSDELVLDKSMFEKCLYGETNKHNDTSACIENYPRVRSPD